MVECEKHIQIHFHYLEVSCYLAKSPVTICINIYKLDILTVLISNLKQGGQGKKTINQFYDINSHDA